MSTGIEVTLVETDGVETPVGTAALAESPRRLERLAQRAWPALEERYHDGWALRFSRGYTRRANSVIPLTTGRLPVRAKIGFCEEEYRRRGLPSIVKITPCAEPRGLDQILAGMGYRFEAETMAQVCPLTELSAVEMVPAGGEITIWSHPAEAWLGAYLECGNATAANLPVLRELLGQMAVEPRYVSLSVAGDPVACALGVIDDGYLGIFSVATTTGHRRRGHAGSMIGHLASWALARGAHTAHLQVLVGNDPARCLYDKLGFREAYRYWYRVLEG